MKVKYNYISRKINALKRHIRKLLCIPINGTLLLPSKEQSIRRRPILRVPSEKNQIIFIIGLRKNFKFRPRNRIRIKAQVL